MTPSSPGAPARRTVAIVLAAGLGTRMKSGTPKVLHELCGRPMLRYVLDAAVGTALDRDDPVRAKPLLASLGALAARCDMRELVVRAHLHRGRLGDRTAFAAARLLAVDIDNPELTRVLVDSPPPVR